MLKQEVSNFIQGVLKNMPTDWLRLTTHRLDIYNEALAKTEFLEHFETLFEQRNTSQASLNDLPTAYDYIRLGHPLSCVLEWALTKSYGLKPDQVISFSSKTAPMLAILRKNVLKHKATRLLYTGALPAAFDPALLSKVYGYQLELKQVNSHEEVTPFDGSTIFFSPTGDVPSAALHEPIDFLVQAYDEAGSVVIINGSKNEHYSPEIQHVRRRETIAMTPANCLTVLHTLIGQPAGSEVTDTADHKKQVISTIQSITATQSNAIVASSGLSTQYAIMMGLVHYANENYPGKAIKFIVPPNCYGGTNDQARRVAAVLDHVAVVDFPVDAGNDMVQSIDTILDRLAAEDAVPYIIAEIPTNPRVEVPDLEKLRDALSKPRKNGQGEKTIDPVFILDQTFCPNVNFLGTGAILAEVSTLAYVSGSKFPSGGLCTAGYCVANAPAEGLMSKIHQHLQLCDNEATALQYQILAQQLPSMLRRIDDAYENTRQFVNFIQEALPDANINFVSEALAQEGFTPSVFSLDLPTKGATAAEQEAYKRELNLQLIHLMIGEIPHESKYCVSYGQLKGCYWTVPATSTQGTTKEGDKDYIVRVAVSGDMDLERHQQVFSQFVASIATVPSDQNQPV